MRVAEQDKMVGEPSRPEAKATALRAKRGVFSSLSARILTINLFSLVFLVGGLLYLDQFRAGLIEARLEAMNTHGKLIAGALGEAALREVAIDGRVSSLTLNSRAVRRILRRLVVVTGTRARLFNPAGKMIADSRFLVAAGRDIITETLPPPEEKNIVLEAMEQAYDAVSGFIVNEQQYPLYFERLEQSASDYAEVGWALDGNIGNFLRQRENGQLMLSSAVPVEGLKRILGGLLLTENGDDIEKSVKAAQITTIVVFAVTVVITLMLSLYLAGTIAQPIHRLAEAADKVRLGVGRRYDLPDFSHRRDEIGDLSSSFREMTAALYDRLDAIEAFAADVSHELKNPLTSLGTAVETFERVEDEATRRQLTDIIISDIKRLDRLITDISAASRLDAELSRSELEPVDMKSLIEAVVEMYARGDENGKKVTILTQVMVRSSIVPGLPGRLGQVIRNLVDNAWSFSDDGGQILIDVTEGDSKLIVEVSDDGPGIPENKRDEIFSRFYSERPKAERFGRHSGLGLSISRQIVEAHGGTLTARNKSAEAGVRAGTTGAIFRMELPIV